MAVDFNKLKKIRIIGQEFDIKESCMTSLSHGAFGLCFLAEQRIEIEPNIPQSKKEETLLHEIIEALNSQLEIELEHNQLTALAAGIYQVIADNSIKFGK